MIFYLLKKMSQTKNVRQPIFKKPLTFKNQLRERRAALSVAHMTGEPPKMSECVPLDKEPVTSADVITALEIIEDVDLAIELANTFNDIENRKKIKIDFLFFNKK